MPGSGWTSKYAPISRSTSTSIEACAGFPAVSLTPTSGWPPTAPILPLRNDAARPYPSLLGRQPQPPARGLGQVCGQIAHCPPELGADRDQLVDRDLRLRRL